MKSAYTVKNSGLTIRSVMVAFSTLAVLAAMESVLVGTPMFALIVISAVALAMLAIAGNPPATSREKEHGSHAADGKHVIA
jgi:hypothetical protein